MNIQSLISTFLLLLTPLSFSQELNPDFLGEFTYLNSFSDTNKYLLCSEDSQLTISSAENDLILSGITISPFKFNHINEPPVGISGPIIGFAQIKTVMKSISNSQIMIESLHRNCEPLLGKLSCIGKKWRVTSWALYTKNDSSTRVQVGYQPFESSLLEICEFEKNNF